MNMCANDGSFITRIKKTASDSLIIKSVNHWQRTKITPGYFFINTDLMIL